MSPASHPQISTASPCERFSRPWITTATPPCAGSGQLKVSPATRTGPDAGHHRRDRDGSRVRCDSLTGEEQALPMQSRREYAADLSAASRRRSHNSRRSEPDACCPQSTSTRVRAGGALTQPSYTNCRVTSLTHGAALNWEDGSCRWSARTQPKIPSRHRHDRSPGANCPALTRPPPAARETSLGQ